MSNDPQEKPRFVLEYDPTNGSFRKIVTGPIPPGFLVNMLEVCKTELVLQQLAVAQHQAQQEAKNRVVVADGPLPKSPFSR